MQKHLYYNNKCMDSLLFHLPCLYYMAPNLPSHNYKCGYPSHPFPAVTLCRLSSALIPAAFYLCTRMQYWQ